MTRAGADWAFILSVIGGLFLLVSVPGISDESAVEEVSVEEIKGWLLGCSGVIWERNCNDFDTVAGMEISSHSVQSEKELLVEWWGIENEEDLHQKMLWLESEGNRIAFAADVNMVADWSGPQAWEYQASHQSQEPMRTAQHVIAWLAVQKGITDVTAWDLCRYINLCRNGYHSGYLDEKTAWRLMIPAGRKLQETYPSWQEMGRSYISGRYWRRPSDMAKSMGEFEDAYLRLCELPESPWNQYPWDLDLSGAERILESIEEASEKAVVEEIVDSAPEDLSMPFELPDLERAPVRTVDELADANTVLVVPDAYATIGAALEAAGEGDAVFIRRGIYEENLKLDRRRHLRVVGEQRDEVVIRPADPNGFAVVHISYCEDLLFSDLTIEFPTKGEPNSSRWGVYTYWGEADFQRCRVRHSVNCGILYCHSRGSVQECLLEHNAKEGIRIVSDGAFAQVRGCLIRHNGLFGISVSKGAEAVIEGSRIESSDGPGVAAAGAGTRVECRRNHVLRNGSHGIQIYQGAIGIVHRCVCEENRKDGILAADGCEDVVVQENVCRRNGQSGIRFYINVSGRISGCVCQANLSNGIWISKNSRAVLEGNRIIADQKQGILVNFDSEVRIVNCTSEGNQGPGIYIWGADTRVTMENNRFMRNARSGIVVTECQSATAVNNVCSENSQNGIFFKSLAEPAVVSGNRCEKNGMTGIGITCSRAEVKGNHCAMNLKQGMGFQDSIIMANRNECTENVENGIVIWGESSEVVLEGNRIAGNGYAGVEAKPVGKAALIGNLIEKNRKTGIIFAGPSQTILAAENECLDNYPVGIRLEAGARGVVRGNRCEGNPWAGILIRGEGTRPIVELNRCSGGIWGILLRDEAGAVWGKDNLTAGNSGGGIKIRHALVY